MFLSAEWRWLVMLNFEFDPKLLAPLVPADTELDDWNGTTYASVVGFMFLRTRVFGVPVPGYRDFEELNLRFYVRRRTPEGWRRGVVFVKEVVPRRVIAAIARYAYNEHYVAHPMRHEIGDGRVEYAWSVGGRWGRLGAEVEGDPGPIEDGSEEEFITEHYFGYVRQRDSGSVEYAVEHPRWRAWRARAATLDADLAALYGPDLAEPLAEQPRSQLVAEGSSVIVRHGVRID
jgi:uncharacterized protein YqjF (DUF2071 family)